MRFLFILLFPLGLFAQTKPIESVIGVKFGVSSTTVRAIAKARGGIVNTSMTNDANSLTYNNLYVGGRKTYAVTF